jgi:hypothetical protein
MNVLTRFLLALTFCTYGIAACFAVASERPLSNHEICREVDAELNNAVREGILTSDDASAISQRCYQRK